MRKIQKMFNNKWIAMAVVWGTVCFCIALLVTLCFDHGIDLDEAYSYRTVHGNDFAGIVDKILSAHDTDIPLWYCALRVWTWIFGESWFAYKMFSVAGSAATMALGATVIRRVWGTRTAIFFILPAGLAPALLHIGVNVRMYSWTVFIVTASGLISYFLAKEYKNKFLWTLLFLLTITGLFSHYFTAFCFLFLYLYLLLEIWRKDKKSVWRVFVCGIAAIVPFFLWLIKADFFHFTGGGEMQMNFDGIDLEDYFGYIFRTNIQFSVLMGVGIFCLVLFALVFLSGKLSGRNRRFAFLCLFMMLGSYLIAAVLSSVARHFFTPRHVVHGLGLMWLGIAIVLPRINLPAYLCGLVFTVIMGMSSYKRSYANEYATTPYIEETKAFIAEEMKPGDIVIYNSEPAFDLLYGCYMPEQEFIYYPRLENLQELAGKRVWFFLCKPEFFSEEVQQAYGITFENVGHYGFQIINDCTDFDLLRLEIRGVQEEK